MRVFVTGTGRCGTVTFFQACRLIQNFTSGHESKAGCADKSRWVYPPDHIEVDPHIAWTLGSILQRYPDAYYVHLQRRREEVVESWFRRGIKPHSGAAPLMDVIFQTVSRRRRTDQYRESLGLLYDVVNNNITQALHPVRSTHIWLHDLREGFAKFWDDIQAEGELALALEQLGRRWNASPAN